MNKLYFLYAAYVVTWIVHISYLVFMTRRASRLRAEIEELKRQ